MQSGSRPATATVWLLRAATRRYGVAVLSALSEAGYRDLPPRGLWAIDALAGTARSPGELVDRLGVTKQAVSQLVDLLVERGYALRRDDERDRRRSVIELTERGSAVAGIVAQTCYDVDLEVSGRLGADGLSAVQSSLARLAGEWSHR